MARDPAATGLEDPSEDICPLRDLRPGDRCKVCRHACLRWLLRAMQHHRRMRSCERAVGSSTEMFVLPGAIRLPQLQCSDTNIGAIKTLFSVQYMSKSEYLRLADAIAGNS